MGFSRSAVAQIVMIALLAGCFGYNKPAKRWAYVGNGALILGGGGAIALDVTSTEEPCMGDNCPYKSSIHGAMVVGVVLVTAGLVGILFNATRDNVRTSR
jgi:hypothetical protein